VNSPNRRIAPYGTWPSQVTPQLLVEQAVGLSHLTVGGGRIFWVESRPSEGGRQALVSVALDSGIPSEVLPEGFSTRTQVHEYGGRCYAVHDQKLVFSNWADQRLWTVDVGSGAPVPLTPEPGRPRSVRFADPVFHPSGEWIACVRETHGEDGEVSNDLVAVPLATGEPHALASGHDFYAAPRFSPDGTRLAWVSWDHPAMPWDATELWVASVAPGGGLADPQRVAGGPEESVTQPRWSPDGVLHYASDRSGWWNLYAEDGRPVQDAEAEFADPDWVFGNASYGFDPAGGLVASWSGPGGSEIGVLSREGRAAGQAFERRAFPFTSYSSVTPIDGGAVVIAGSPTEPPAVVRLEWASGEHDVLRRSREVALPAASLSLPRPVEFPTGDGDTAHALFYPPASDAREGPEGERPPLVVILHGGPTSSTSAVLNLAVQFWTTRGFAVADVDYRGSSGHGRAYRAKLRGTWGLVDVEDCAAVVRYLGEQGLADPARAAIRGGSAGGFTTLAALAFTDAFAAGASHYGVADLELLARDTHKFEARYLDGLIGPWPEAAGEYRRRSPIHHVEEITAPLILFQGLEDTVVPPAQSELMYKALADRGVPVAYLAFEGEHHGFRRAETIVAVMSAEVEFYGRVFGFEPDLPEHPPLDIANADRLPGR
jgi:dipeptidyl aminopeptidase/acylaminoacyl peptidase